MFTKADATAWYYWYGTSDPVTTDDLDEHLLTLSKHQKAGPDHYWVRQMQTSWIFVLVWCVLDVYAVMWHEGSPPSFATRLCRLKVILAQRWWWGCVGGQSEEERDSADDWWSRGWSIKVCKERLKIIRKRMPADPKHPHPRPHQLPRTHLHTRIRWLKEDELPEF